MIVEPSPRLCTLGPAAVRLPLPVILVDRREKTPLHFKRYPSALATIPTGDYSIRGAETLFTCERKSLKDLAACCQGRDAERFERELLRMRGYPFARLLIVGNPSSISDRTRCLLDEWEVRFAPVAVRFAPTPEAAARLIERWAYAFTRCLVETAYAVKEAGDYAEAQAVGRGGGLELPHLEPPGTAGQLAGILAAGEPTP